MCSLSRTMIARQHSISSFKGIRVRHPSSADEHIAWLLKEEEASHVQSVCRVFGSQQEVDQVVFVFLVNDTLVWWNSVPRSLLQESSDSCFQSITPIPSLPRMNNNCVLYSTALPLTRIWKDSDWQKERFTRQVTYNDFHIMWLISIEQVHPCLMLLNSTILSWYTISGTHLW